MTYVKIAEGHDPLCERALGMTKKPTPGCPRCDALVARLDEIKIVATRRAKKGPPVVSRDARKAAYFRESAFGTHADWSPADEFEDPPDTGARFDSEANPIPTSREAVRRLQRTGRRLWRRTKMVACVVAVLGAGSIAYAGRGNGGCPVSTREFSDTMTDTCVASNGTTVCQENPGTLDTFAWPACPSWKEHH